MARFAPKPCGRIGRERRLCRVKAVRTSGQERRLCRVKAVRTMAMARFAPKPCGQWLWLGSRQSRADERTGQEAEAKMGVILALRR